jgi:diacylglycerol kinase
MKKFINSVKFAIQGIRSFILTDRNGRIEIIFAVVVIILGAFLSISTVEWLIVIFCIGLVISLEMVNAAIEKYCDMVTTAYHPVIKIIKDVAAGAVLTAALISMVTGLIIFIPAILNFLKTI